MSSLHRSLLTATLTAAALLAGCTEAPTAGPPTAPPDTPPATPACDPTEGDHADPVAALAEAVAAAQQAAATPIEPAGTLLYRCHLPRPSGGVQIDVWTQAPEEMESIGFAKITVDGAATVVESTLFRGVYGGTTFEDDVIEMEVACGQFGLSVNYYDHSAIFMDLAGEAQVQMACE